MRKITVADVTPGGAIRVTRDDVAAANVVDKLTQRDRDALSRALDRDNHAARLIQLAATAQINQSAARRRALERRRLVSDELVAEGHTRLEADAMAIDLEPEPTDAPREIVELLVYQTRIILAGDIGPKAAELAAGWIAARALGHTVAWIRPDGSRYSVGTGLGRDTRNLRGGFASVEECAEKIVKHVASQAEGPHVVQLAILPSVSTSHDLVTTDFDTAGTDTEPLRLLLHGWRWVLVEPADGEAMDLAPWTLMVDRIDGIKPWTVLRWIRDRKAAREPKVVSGLREGFADILEAEQRGGKVIERTHNVDIATRDDALTFVRAQRSA